MPVTQHGKQLHLGINVNASGRHPASWRMGAGALSFLTPEFHEEIGRIAERGLLDAVFYNDGYWHSTTQPWQAFDPVAILSATARVTSHVGLVATISSTFTPPYILARQVATLDHISGGRAGWNVVTTAQSHVARLFGYDEIPSHEERYARADEAVAAVLALWDSWEPDALIGDTVTGEFADAAKVHPVDLDGTYYRMHGAFNVPRTPQGRPVLFQAGGSPQGTALAAKYADAIFCVHHTLPAAQEFYRSVKGAAKAHGRNPDQLLIMPGLFPVLGSTEAEARARKNWLDEIAGFDVELNHLAHTLGIHVEDLKLDSPLPWDLIDQAGFKKDRSHGFAKAAIDLARSEDLTVRQMLERNPNGHRSIVGTPEQVADSMAQWLREGGCDGFNLNADFFHEGLANIADNLVPELQKRGIFRREYVGSTLRDHLALPTTSKEHA